METLKELILMTIATLLMFSPLIAVFIELLKL